MLQTENRTSPHSEFPNTSDCVGEVWGLPPRSCLVSLVFPGSGNSANYLPCPGGCTRCDLHFLPNPRISPAAGTGRHSGKTHEGLLGDPSGCRQKTEPPHSQNSGTRLTVWGSFGAAHHAPACCHRCSLAGGIPLNTSPVQGEALDATSISSPTPAFPRSPHWEIFGEDTRRAPRRSRVLQTYDGTSPLSEFRNTADSVGEVWGRPPRSCLVSQVFPGRGNSANYLPCPGGGTRCYLNFQPNPRLFPAARNGRESGKTREGLLGDPGCYRPKTEPPHTQNSGTRLTEWRRFVAALHAAAWCHRCSLAGGSPLITSLVQGEALDSTCNSSPTPSFSRQPAMGGNRGKHAKGS